jgi:hypothetical protein
MKFSALIVPCLPEEAYASHGSQSQSHSDGSGPGTLMTGELVCNSEMKYIHNERQNPANRHERNMNSPWIEFERLQRYHDLLRCLSHYIILGKLILSLILNANDPGHVSCGPCMLFLPIFDGPTITRGSAFLHKKLNFLRTSCPYGRDESIKD